MPSGIRPRLMCRNSSESLMTGSLSSMCSCRGFGMTFQVSSDSPVFVDLLDFTLPEVMGCIPDFRAFLESFGFAGQQDDRSWIYRVPESSGVVRLTSGIR